MLKVIKSFSFAWYTLSLILLLTEIEIFLYWILILLLQGKLPAPAVCTTYTVIHLAQMLLKCFKENGYRFNVKAILLGNGLFFDTYIFLGFEFHWQMPGIFYPY